MVDTVTVSLPTLLSLKFSFSLTKKLVAHH